MLIQNKFFLRTPKFQPFCQMPFSPGEYFQRTLYNIKKIDMALKDYKIQNTIRNIFIMQFCIKYTQ